MVILLNLPEQLVLVLAIKLSNRINLAIEDRVTFIKDDLLDGQRWAEQGDLTTEILILTIMLQLV